MNHRGVWRDPGEETQGLYSGADLVVHDGRQSGSITLGRSRLPIWSLVGSMEFAEWDDYQWDDDAPPGSPHHGVTQLQLQHFYYYLSEMRGEFARLLLVLADVERLDARRVDSGDDTPWWEHEQSCARVRAQLRRCLATLPEGITAEEVAALYDAMRRAREDPDPSGPEQWQ